MMKHLIPPRFPLSAVAAACMMASSFVLAEESTTQPDTSIQQDTYQSDTTDTQTDTTATIGRSSNVEAKLSSEFAEFLGGEEAAAEVVESLRTGQGFSWTQNGDGEPLPDASAADVPPPTENALPTGTMGYGNVRLTLKLAEASLADLGIDQPTNEQLSAMLLGGEIDGTAYEGILVERAAGAGWGELAQRYGFKVGDLMGNRKGPVGGVPADDGQVIVEEGAGTGPDPAPEIETGQEGQEGVAATQAAGTVAGKAVGRPDHASSGQGSRLANGYIPSGGASAAGAAKVGHGHATKVKTGGGTRANGYIPSGGPQGQGAGIVSAGGGHAASASGNGGLAKGHLKTSGAASGSTGGGAIVSAGNASSAATASNAGGNGLGKGHAKGRP
jgi:hypothetical protein